MKKKQLKKLPKKIRKEIKQMQKKLVEMEDFYIDAQHALDLVEEVARNNAAFQIKINEQCQHLKSISEQITLTKEQRRQFWALDKLLIELDAAHSAHHWLPYNTWGEKEALEMAIKMNREYTLKDQWPDFGPVDFLSELGFSSYAEDMDKILASWNAGSEGLEGPQEEAV